MDSLGLYTLAQTGYLMANQPQLLYATTVGIAGNTVTYTVVRPYNRVLCLWYARSSTAATAEQIYLQINGISTASYLWQNVQGNNATASAASSGGLVTSIQVGTVPGSTALVNFWGSGQFVLDGANQSAYNPTVQGTACGFITTTNSYNGTYAGSYTAGVVTSSLLLSTNSGGFAAGSQFSFYGLS